MAYFSNGSEGEILDNQCDECHLSYEAPCPVLLVQQLFNYRQLDENGEETMVSEAMNNLIDEEGICKMKPVIDEFYE